MDLPKTIEDIEKLIEARVQESLNLDYKRSNSVDDKKRAEIAKDVSAFANSDGGLLIYGVEEEEHLPIKIDDGVEHKRLNREWLENVITSNIAPRIEDIQIAQIPLSDTHSVFAVKIPKSFRGPHQERSESKRYYRRFNFKSEAMEDYEIREAYNRRREVPSLVNMDVEIDRKVAKFVVKNYGDSTARDIHLRFSDGMVWLEEGRAKAVIEKGISNLTPGKTMRFLYNVLPNLLEMSDNRARCFGAHVDYFHPEIGQRISENFSFDLNDFRHTLSDQSDIERLTQELTRELKDLTKEVKKLDERLEKVSHIASATGLNISIPTVENLRHIVEQTGEVEKAYPLYCSAEVFMEVLKVPYQVAWNFAEYFRGGGEAEDVSQIKGTTPEVLERFNRYFAQLKVLKPPPNRPRTLYRDHIEDTESEF